MRSMVPHFRFAPNSTCSQQIRRSSKIMNNLQKEAQSLAVDGHNVIITGQCGTGKSYTVK